VASYGARHIRGPWERDMAGGRWCPIRALIA
jgi:hypothetical protein